MRFVCAEKTHPTSDIPSENRFAGARFYISGNVVENISIQRRQSKTIVEMVSPKEQRESAEQE
jgi:hypothetical protein